MYKQTAKARPLKISYDPALLRNDQRYQDMRDEIDRGQAPFGGSIDWKKVCAISEELSLQKGADLLTAAYYLSAISKTRGVSGLASGLELLAALLRYSPEVEDMPVDKVANIVNWAVAKILTDIKKITVLQEDVRNWYRCEYACQQMLEYFVQKKYAKTNQLDSLGFQIFEKIERIERVANYPQLDLLEQKPTPIIKPLLNLMLMLLFGLTGLGLGSFYADKIYQEFPNVYQAAALNQVESVESLLSRLLFLPQPKDITLEHSQRKNLLRQLDASYSQLAAARTKMANLAYMAEHLPRYQLKLQQQSVELSQYASSLSPLLARTYFIESLLQDKHTTRAAIELKKLDKQIEALLLKRLQLGSKLSHKPNKPEAADINRP